MRFTVYFSKAGAPETGLSPTITVLRVSDAAALVTDAAMTEIGLGFYKSADLATSVDEEYIALADSDDVDMTGGEKYAPCISTVQGDVELIRAIEAGRWKIDTTTDPDTMIFYAEDGITEVKTFELTPADVELPQYKERAE